MTETEDGLQTIEQEVHHALQYLYDPTELRKNRLLSLLGLEEGQSPLTRLRRTLSGAIEAIKPDRRVPSDAHAWRIYNILTYRYVERLSQREVAADLCLSVRQLRRDEHSAIRVLTHYLMHHYQVDPSVLEQDEAPEPESQERVQELEWLRQTFPSESVDICTLITSVVSTAVPLIQASNVIVTHDIPADLPPVRGQVATVRQALLNVLSTTVPASANGEVRIKVQSTAEETALTVCGRTLEGALVPVDPQMSASFEISRELIEVGGGNLKVHGAAQGCMVTLTFPTAQPLRTPVLVIDDNVDTQQLFQRYLGGTRFDLVCVSDPELALLQAAEMQPEVIVLDVMLPGTDGWEVLGRLREHPQTRDIPVVICTILPQEKLALALGAAAFLQKPFTRDSLSAVLVDLTAPQVCSAR